MHILPKFPKDSTDRNRTSPFAFTGNKFEFRSLGSSQSISGPNVVLNTIIAESLRKYADELEPAADFTAALNALIRRVLREHKRIIFNGNGYDPSWLVEAERRGLLNLRSTVDALPYYVSEKNVAVFAAHKVLTEQEVHSRYEIKLENYVKVLFIEALSMLDIARRMILPATIAYSGDVAKEIGFKKSVTGHAPAAESRLLGTLETETNALYDSIEALDQAVKAHDESADMLAQAQYTRDTIVPAMTALRAAADALEPIVGKEYWPMPTYQDMLMYL